MQLTGLAQPFWTPSRYDGQFDVSADCVATETSRAVSAQFSPEAFIHAHENDVEILVAGVWREHLASVRHGLQLFTTPHGLYFHAQLPDTPYARQIYAAVQAEKIKYVCAISSRTFSNNDGSEPLTVWRADLTHINLLLGGFAHYPTTWVTAAGVPAQTRIEREAHTAEKNTLWRLSDKLTAEACDERQRLSDALQKQR
jgi:phage head maturation protease